MALEKDFELLDDYLSNRMSGADKEAFENRLNSDPELQQELSFQKELVDGIRSARMMELKSMLNNIPVSTIPTGQSMVVKVGTWVAAAGIVATSLYFFLDNEPVKEQPQNETILEESSEVKSKAPDEQESTGTTEEVTSSEPVTEAIEEKKESVTKPKVEATKPSSVTKPKIEVYDPNKDASASTFNASEQMEIISKAFVTSSIEVVTEKNSLNYKFHYAFMDNKLVLYGISEKDLYEILEFISDDKRTVFLYYKTNYYWLDSLKSNPSPLIPIRDTKLLAKLKEYRKN